MKKFIPYIFITAFAGTFLTLSFLGPFSVPKETNAQQIVVGGDYANGGKSLFSGISGAALWGAEKLFDLTFGNLIAWISDLAAKLATVIFNIAAIIMDKAVDFSIRDFKSNIEKIGIIDQGYKMVLNLANMIFIFILLYIAINTILGIGGGDIKKLLTNVIVVALLINFSLFMTKVIIDASNILAMGFYNGIQTETRDDESGTTFHIGSISTALMNGLRLSSMFPSKDSEVAKADETKGLNHLSITLVNFGNSAILLVTSFVFFAVAILFIMRFVTLLFYMIFSPVAFLGFISPELKPYSSKWWRGLQNQAMFAPVFMFMVYLISAIINSNKLWILVGGEFNGTSTFYDAFGSSFSMAYQVIINYGILMAMMIGALITSKEMAKIGSNVGFEYAEKVRGWAQGVAGRNMLGRTAYVAGDSDRMAKFVSDHPMVGGFVKNRFDSVAGASFGGAKGGYAKALKDSVEQKRKTADWLRSKGQNEAAKKIEDKIAGEKEVQKKREEDMPGLREDVANAQEKYDKAEKEREKWQKEYDSYEDDKSKKELERAKEKAEQAKQELDREEGYLMNEKMKSKESQKTIKDAEEELKKTQNKYKNDYAENIKFKSNALNKLFPSGVKAAEVIRKGKKPVVDVVRELMEESGEIEKKVKEVKEAEKKKSEGA